VYPHFLPNDTGVRLPLLAREINDSMAAYGVEQLERALGTLEGTTVLILGLAYRPNVKEAAYSSAFALADALRTRGSRPLVHDPLFSDVEISALGLEPADAFPPARVDSVVVQALHDAYRELDVRTFLGCRAVLDGRNALDPASVEAAGMKYIGIGR
jgi:UDP-N-acetyl-D-mannosaminuronate dehydrogenase